MVWRLAGYYLRLTGTVSRADGKGLRDVFLVTVVGGIIKPAVRDESIRVAEVSRRCVGVVVVDRNNGLGMRTLAITEHLDA